MPAMHPSYPCLVCGKAHALYLPHRTVPDLNRQLYYVCPGNGFAVRVTKADGWKAVEGKPEMALTVHGTEMSNRVES